jgi:pyridoxine 4-dehydrogenase
VLARSPLMLPIPATTSITHLRQNLDAEDLELNPEQITAINDLERPRTTAATWPSRYDTG